MRSKATTKNLQTLTAIVEAGAGAALLGFPSATSSLLLGMPLSSSAALSVGRVAGAGLLALAIACWLARRDPHGIASRGLLVAISFYNAAVVGLLVAAGLSSGLLGVLLWPAAALHFAMGVWCITDLKSS